jgi:PAS domain S-box-containing protein
MLVLDQRIADPDRLAALDATGLLDSGAEPSFDRLTRIAAAALGAPIALVSLVTDERQYFKSCVGLPEPWAGRRETPLSHSFCQHVVTSGSPLVVDDAARHPLVCDNAAVSEIGVAAYLGVPIVTAAGQVLGSLCAIDGVPRRWSEAQVALLADVAASVVREIELRSAVRESRRARAFAACSADAMLAVDGAGHVRFWNPAAEAVFGYPAAEIVGRDFTLLMPERFRAQHRAAFAATGVGEVPPQLRRAVQWVGLRRDGSEFPLELTLSSWRDESGPALGAVVRDASARNRAQAALRESEARLSLIYNGASDLMFLVAVEGGGGEPGRYRCVSVNSAYLAVTGLASDQVVGRTVHEVLPDPAAAYVLGKYDEAAATGQTLRYEEEVDVPLGRIVLETTLTPVLDDAGRCTHLLGAARDVTARAAAEAARRRLASILELTPDIVATATPDGRLAYVNAAGRKLLGVTDATPAALLTFTVADVQPQFGRGAALERAIRRVARDGCWRGETTLTKRDGRVLPVEQVVITHAGPDGQVEFVSAVLRDITERRQAEATLRALALIDELTGLYNRRGFLAAAEPEWQRARRDGRAASVYYVDVDHFKQINDGHGHAVGDDALRAVAAVLRRTFREADVVARLGGDEFVVLAVHGAPPPAPRDAAGAPDGEAGTAVDRRILARLTREVAAENARGAAAGAPFRVTLSTGVAHAAARADLPAGAPEPTLAALMVAADDHLYARKRSRRASARRSAAE